MHGHHFPVIVFIGIQRINVQNLLRLIQGSGKSAEWNHPPFEECFKELLHQNDTRMLLVNQHNN